MPLADRNYLDRRAHTRYPVSMPALLGAADGSGSMAATVVDISLGGALLIAGHELEPGSSILVELQASSLLVRLFARIVAISGEPPSVRVHLAFASADRSSLVSLIDQLASRSGTPHDRARRATIASPRTFRI
ncbi:MAG: PilZ domain-containing protein [Dehalococcoidia bacterium]